MWTMTRYGFFSAVCARKGDGSKGRPVEPNAIMVRARLREHLDNLQAFAAAVADREDDPTDVEMLRQVAFADIRESSTTDYRCRIFIAKTAWAVVLSRLALDEDYDNFKSAVLARMGGCPYEEALHRVWSVMYGIQERATGPGIYSHSSVPVDASADAGLDYNDMSDADDVLVIIDRRSQKDRRVAGYVVRPRDLGTDEDAYREFVERYPEKAVTGTLVLRHQRWGSIKHLRGEVAIY